MSPADRDRDGDWECCGELMDMLMEFTRDKGSEGTTGGRRLKKSFFFRGGLCRSLFNTLMAGEGGDLYRRLYTAGCTGTSGITYDDRGWAGGTSCARNGCKLDCLTGGESGELSLWFDAPYAGAGTSRSVPYSGTARSVPHGGAVTSAPGGSRD